MRWRALTMSERPRGFESVEHRIEATVASRVDRDLPAILVCLLDLSGELVAFPEKGALHAAVGRIGLVPQAVLRAVGEDLDPLQEQPRAEPLSGFEGLVPPAEPLELVVDREKGSDLQTKVAGYLEGAELVQASFVDEEFTDARPSLCQSGVDRLGARFPASSLSPIQWPCESIRPGRTVAPRRSIDPVPDGFRVVNARDAASADGDVTGSAPPVHGDDVRGAKAEILGRRQRRGALHQLATVLEGRRLRVADRPRRFARFFRSA